MWATLVVKGERDYPPDKCSDPVNPEKGFTIELFVPKAMGPEIANVFPNPAGKYLNRTMTDAGIGFFNNGLEWKYLKTRHGLPDPQ